ncbi:MAG: hypothetical protein FWC16_00065 [Defluviitaleaceae bacterium]|nr:hypothetical protein [Defluviitaleaceae bacterium]MCL2273297.1 hypothetical protein [Defluviitaleaceae bacterium]
MKKYMTVFVLCIFGLFLTSCNQYNYGEINYEETDKQIIVENVYTLPFFVDYVYMSIVNFEDGEIQITVVNNSDYEFFTWGNIPYYYYYAGQNIKFDIWDGENWVAIIHLSVMETDLIGTISPPEKIYIAPHSTATIAHDIRLYPLPSTASQLRIRKHIYMDTTHFPDGILNILRNAHEADANSWFHLPGLPRHTLTLEFKWEGFNIPPTCLP